MNQHPDARVTVTGGGTGVGISALMDNTTILPWLPVRSPAKSDENQKAGQEVDEVIVAYDALCRSGAPPSNPVKQLTRQQLEDIFRGKITN